jgi:hypothetical protein
MKEMDGRKLARVLRVLVLITLICNLIALVLVPGAVAFYSAGVDLSELVNVATQGDNFFFKSPGPIGFAAFYGYCLLVSYVNVWRSDCTAVLTVFFWVCDVCTAVILWQAKGVLDSILAEETFTSANASHMKRAAVCCFVISGAALVRTAWGVCCYHSVWPLLTYNFLFVPVFLIAGLVCMVMSALFRQAAELKADQDLTI